MQHIWSWCQEKSGGSKLSLKNSMLNRASEKGKHMLLQCKHQQSHSLTPWTWSIGSYWLTGEIRTATWLPSTAPRRSLTSVNNILFSSQKSSWSQNDGDPKIRGWQVLGLAGNLLLNNLLQKGKVKAWARAGMAYCSEAMDFEACPENGTFKSFQEHADF